MPGVDILICELQQGQPAPMELLLLADPSVELINEYLIPGKCFVALLGEEIAGAMVLTEFDQSTMEIKNIAVAETYQGRGIGKRLLQYAGEFARRAVLLSHLRLSYPKFPFVRIIIAKANKEYNMIYVQPW